MWLAVHAAVGLRMLLMGLVVEKWLFLNCAFSMGLSKKATEELIACTICDCREILPVLRLW